MTTELKKEISDHLGDALNLEDLRTRDAARILNLNPAYISMAVNPKIHDSMSKAAWERLQDWHDTRDKLADFRYPEEEPVWQQTPKKERSLPDDPPKEVARTEELKKRRMTEQELTKVLEKIPAPFKVEEIKPINDQQFTDTARLKVALDIEINLVVNGQKVKVN